MYIFTCVQPSPFPVLAQDGAVMTIDGAGHNILPTVNFQASNLTDKKIEATRNGKIEIGLVRVRSRAATFPIFLFKFGGMVFDVPFSIGLEADNKRASLTHALSHADSLTRNATWGLTLETVERTTHMTKSIRMIAPSPRFWKAAADSLLGSAGLTREMQHDMLQRLYSKYPMPSQLFRRAVYVEKFR
ncbi:hypothetical protein [Roseovarius nanhaiticus]|uniref:hypothetical protein n=1 Tax=Roseovarius nanhaiticus TaxID=573024 RepID=UPI002492DBCB|nr:hypothetical protein [Roseovarius nanhaiticus]